MPAYKDPRNGLWRFRARLELPNGKKVRFSGTPKTNTKKAAEHAERLAIQRRLNPPARQRKKTADAKIPTVKEYNELYIRAHEKKQKPNAIKSRRQVMNAYILPAFGAMPLDTIRQVDIDMLQADLLETRTGKTVNNIMSALSSVMKYAGRNGVIPTTTLRFWMQTQDSEIQGMTEEEIEALLEACDDQRYRVAILLGCEAGLRVGEIRALRWSDIADIGETILVRRSYDSSGKLTPPKGWKNRTVPMSERLAEELANLEETGETVLTQLSNGRPLSYWAVRDKIHEIYEAAGVTPGMVWHSLRHAYCSRLAAEGVPINVIKELAGHKSIETTLRYMHTSLNAKKAAIAGVFGAPKKGRKKTASRNSGQQVANKPPPKREKLSN